MPLLLQARITALSFEEARYRHFRAKELRCGTLQKAWDQVNADDATQATRRLFARTVGQVVEIHALEHTFDAWLRMPARPKAPALPARPKAADEYDPRSLDLGMRLAQRVLDDRTARSRLRRWAAVAKRSSPTEPSVAVVAGDLADGMAMQCGLIALGRSLKRRRRGDAFRRWAARPTRVIVRLATRLASSLLRRRFMAWRRADNTQGLESALFEAQRTLDARRCLGALDDAWRRRRRERLRRVLGRWRASGAGGAAAVEALTQERDAARAEASATLTLLGAATASRDAGAEDAAQKLRGELEAITAERDAAKSELATATAALEAARASFGDAAAADVAAAQELRGELEARTAERDAARAGSGDAAAAADEKIERAREAADEVRADAVRRAVAAADARAEEARSELQTKLDAERRDALDEQARTLGARHAEDLDQARESVGDGFEGMANMLRNEIADLKIQLESARAEATETTATAADARSLDRRRSLVALDVSFKRRRREHARRGFLRLGEAGRAKDQMRTRLSALSDACERRRRDRMRRVLVKLTTTGADGALKAARNAWARGNVSRRIADAKRSAFTSLRCRTLEAALAVECSRAERAVGALSAAEFAAIDSVARRERSDAAAAYAQATALHADTALATAVAMRDEAAAASGEQVQNAADAEERASTERARLEQLLVDAKMEIVHLMAAQDAVQPSERLQMSSAPPSEASELGEAPPQLPPRSRVGRFKSAAASFASRSRGREK